MMSSTSQPTVSATICARIVSEPVPMSVAPMSRLKEPSSFILSDAPPMSMYGMAVPCIANAAPTPRRRLGRPGTACQSTLPRFADQPNRLRPICAVDQRARLDVLGYRLATFGPRLREGLWLARTHRVLQAELHRVHLERPGDSFHL